MEWRVWGGVRGQVWLGDTLAYLFAGGADGRVILGHSHVYWMCVSRVCVFVVSLCLVRTRGVGGPVARAP